MKKKKKIKKQDKPEPLNTEYYFLLLFIGPINLNG